VSIIVGFDIEGRSVTKKKKTKKKKRIRKKMRMREKRYGKMEDRRQVL
jgi:hypothetical protein